jgi:hypothetical protein
MIGFVFLLILSLAIGALAGLLVIYKSDLAPVQSLEKL